MIVNEDFFNKNYITILRNKLDKKYYEISKISEIFIIIVFKLYPDTVCYINKIYDKNVIYYFLEFKSKIINLQDIILEKDVNITRDSIGDVIDCIREANDILFYNMSE